MPTLFFESADALYAEYAAKGVIRHSRPGQTCLALPGIHRTATAANRSPTGPLNEVHCSEARRIQVPTSSSPGFPDPAFRNLLSYYPSAVHSSPYDKPPPRTPIPTFTPLKESPHPAWPASTPSAPSATTPAASAWKTSSPSPTTRSPRAMQQRYYEASPYNLIRIILGKHEPADTEPQEFLPAAGTRPQRLHPRRRLPLATGASEQILAEEAEPALYGYSQTYTVPVPQSRLPHHRDSRPRAPRLHRPRPPLRLCRQGRLPPRADLSQAQVRPPRPLQSHPRLLRADLHALLRPRLYRRKAHLRLR